MARRYVKAVYEWKDDGERWTFTFDLLLDGDDMVPSRPYLGHSGSPKGLFYPFLMKADGTIDFGSDYEGTPDRLMKTNMVGRKVRVGEMFTATEWRSDEGNYVDYLYRCISVEAMLVGAG